MHEMSRHDGAHLHLSRGLPAIIAAVATLLTVSACSSGEDETTDAASTAQSSSAAPPSPDAATPSPETSPEPPVDEPVTATPEQLASIIAERESGWRETIDEAYECRILYVLTDIDDPARSAQRTSCYWDEITIGLEAGTTGNDLGEHTPPDSMIELVDETRAVLTTIADIDLETECGPMSEPPPDTEECNLALGQRVLAYQDLESVLDSWGPYL